jgi:indole-3-glycerol phosphate synthase
MPDFLDQLARDAKATVVGGYYTATKKARLVPSSLVQSITQCKTNPVIAEIKAASPSAGTLRENVEPEKLAQAMVRGGAVGISVLTEPKHFHGSLENLARVRAAVNLPILMKDIVVSPLQLAAAAKLGANAVLLIQGLFDRGYCKEALPQMIADAHTRKLEVLLETRNLDEFRRAAATETDLIGINNRDLASLGVNLNVTKRILKQESARGKIVVSESGITSPADLLFLRGCGANAFLIGGAIMLAADVEAKVREFVKR